MFKNLFAIDKFGASMLALYVGSSVVEDVLKDRQKARDAQRTAMLKARADAQKLVDDLTKERDKVAQQIKARDAVQPAKKTIADLSDQEWMDLWDKL